MPTTGAIAMAQRVGTAELSTGTLCSTDQMPGTPVLMPLRKMRGPSDMAAKSSAMPAMRDHRHAAAHPDDQAEEQDHQAPAEERVLLGRVLREAARR